MKTSGLKLPPCEAPTKTENHSFVKKAKQDFHGMICEYLASNYFDIKLIRTNLSSSSSASSASKE